MNTLATDNVTAAKSSLTTASAATVDEHGNPTSGPAEAIERYDSAIDRLLGYHVDVVDQMTSLTVDHPSFPMGQVLAAYLNLMSTDARDLDAVGIHAAALDGIDLNARESAHAATISAWRAGDWHGASRRLDELLIEWPTDMLALMIGHQLDFFVGDARNLRDRVGRSISAIDSQHPHFGFARGMQAFGLEESGHYGLAEQAALEAVDRNPDDVWAVHAAAHVYEMQGRVADGAAFMDGRVADWGSGNLFVVHNSWHRALFHLEQGQHDRVLDIYDHQVHHADSDGVPIEMLDASALLWRLLLDDVGVDDRFDVIADAWAHAIDGTPSWYAFNDAHAVMAFLGAGRYDDAVAVVDRLDAYVDRAAPGTAASDASNIAMTAEVGLPVARALVAFDDGRYDDAITDLWQSRRVFHHFGGSHAQRDVLERTLVEAAIRDGRTDLAERLVSERLAVRPTGQFALDRQLRLARNVHA